MDTNNFCGTERCIRTRKETERDIENPYRSVHALTNLFYDVTKNFAKSI